MNISEVIGQPLVKRVVEIALAGNHNLLLIGPQGSGKTMWGEIVKSLSAKDDLIFMDDMLEGIEKADCYTIFSSSGSVIFLKNKYFIPSNSLLIATSRLCPCGNSTHPHHECRCEVDEVIQYRNQMPMWLLRAFDLIIELTIPRYEEFRLDFQGEHRRDIRERIDNVILIQEERFGDSDICWNSQMPISLLKIHAFPNHESNLLLQTAVKELGFCVGDYLSILRVARTVADLAQSEAVQAEHIAEAIQYSSIDWFTA